MIHMEGRPEGELQVAEVEEFLNALPPATRTAFANTAGRPLAEFLPEVYEELRHLAANYLYQERPGHTLQPTALVHEAYLKLMDQHSVNWQNRAHFMGIA